MAETLVGIAVALAGSAYLVGFAWIAGRAWEAADDWKLYRRSMGVQPRSREPIRDCGEMAWARRWYGWCIGTYVVFIPIHLYALVSVLPSGLLVGLAAFVYLGYSTYVFARTMHRPAVAATLCVVAIVPLFALFAVAWLLIRSKHRMRSIDTPRPAVPSVS